MSCGKQILLSVSYFNQVKLQRNHTTVESLLFRVQAL